MIADNGAVLAAYERHMQTAHYSPVTIAQRLELLTRLGAYLAPSSTLLAATPNKLAAFQESFAHLSRASVDIYSRHVRALYVWLLDAGHLTSDPTRRMVIACATGGLRTAYVLAAFAGLRCGEVCRLRVEDVRLAAGTQTTALIHGKGGAERIVPLLPPVVDELNRLGRQRGPYALSRSGEPFRPQLLSRDSSEHMARLGVASSLHSLRHYFATEVVRQTRDVLLVKDLLGHASLQTTQIYMQSSVDDADTRLAGFAGAAASVLS